MHNNLNAFFVGEAFCAPPVIGDGFGYGDLGRGVAFGPDQRNLDFAISKVTPLPGWTKESSLEFRTEFFNLFNTPQFAGPARDVGAPGFGTITATAVAPRLVQFAVKLRF
ncbi:MAG: hypothetical protein L0387_17595 [Acidobacteria bacterium]|nr:hypothetical protein [Acidobacteriota bacterium]